MSKLILEAYQILKEKGIISLINSSKRFFYNRFINIISAILGLTLPIIGYVIRQLDRITQTDPSLILIGGGKSHMKDDTHLFYEYCVEHDENITAIWVDNNDYMWESDYGSKVNFYSIKSIYFILKSTAIFETRGINNITYHKSFVPNSTKIVTFTDGITIDSGKRTNATAVKSDYYVVTSEFAAKTFNKRKNFRGQYLVTGLPGYKHLVHTSEEQHDDWECLINDVDQDNIILYSPTKMSVYPKKDRNPQCVLFPFDDFSKETLFSTLVENNILLLIRPHPTDTENMSKELPIYKEMQQLINSLYSECELIKYLPVQTWSNPYSLLKFVDVLITDFSGIYFDYLLLDRPILFAPYDFELFDRHRGSSFAYNDLPGRTINSFDDFCEALSHVENESFSKEYSEEREKMCDKIHEYKDKPIERILNFVYNELLLDESLINPYESQSYKLLSPSDLEE